MIVKIFNTGSTKESHYTYNDPYDYYYEKVVSLTRKKDIFDMGYSTYDISVFTLKFEDGSDVQVTANSLVFICNDDGKTIEKINHECQSYGLDKLPSLIPENK